MERILDQYSLTQLNTIPAGFNNNILWNIGHSIATQQLLVYGLSALPFTISQTFIDRYRKGTKPEGEASTEEVSDMKDLLFTTLEQLQKDYKSEIFKDYKEYTLSTTGGILSKVEHAIAFNNFHEGLHLGYCMSIAKFI